MSGSRFGVNEVNENRENASGEAVSEASEPDEKKVDAETAIEPLAAAEASD